ncbi:MAG: hypothetical protein ACK5H2_04525 [Beutenbergiaceae bacterium]
MIALIVGGLALLAVFAMLAPLDTLRWWAARPDGGGLESLVAPPSEATGTRGRGQPDRFAVYLSGVGAVDGTTDSHHERATLAQLQQSLPQVKLVADVFPYAVENRGLTQRASTWFWGRLIALRRTPLAPLSYLIQLRNVMRVLVSADSRYGPTFNLAVTEQIVDSLTRHGYDWRVRPPVTIIGYSGGGQVALGATWYLTTLGVEVSVVSIGGVFGSDPGLERVSHLWHLYGAKDLLHRLGPLAFPGRWPTAPRSAWHRAVARQRVTIRCLGPMKHDHGRDYFDHRANTADGVSYRQVTVDALVQILTGASTAGDPDTAPSTTPHS